MRELLQRKWANIQEIRLYFEDYGSSYSDDRYMRSLIKTMEPLQVTSPYLCLCVTVAVEKETRTLLKALNVAVCESFCTWEKDWNRLSRGIDMLNLDVILNFLFMAHCEIFIRKRMFSTEGLTP